MIVKKISIFFFLLIPFFTISIAQDNQILEPVEIESNFMKIDDSTFIIKIDVVIDEHWHVYSHYIKEGGPVPSSIIIESLDNVVPADSIKEIGALKEEHDPNFDMILKWYGDKVSFYQIFKLNGETGKIKGYFEYMTCDDKQCLPPDYIDFEYNVPDDAIDATEDIMKLTGSNENDSDKSIWVIFLISFLSGFAALLTPCVFPMIPMTVTFFTKQSKTRATGIKNAIIYGISIIVIYVALGYSVTAIFGADAMNALSTNVIFNIFFFLLLVVFAAAFLGAFEITLPSSWVNKVDRQADRGGLIGIFFMAAALGLVSFSCTGPIIGTLLVEAAVHGGVTGPLIGMFGFSLALALPFGLFAAFPGWLNSLPQSGGWLNSVKVVLGFLELALAFKFLSNADLVSQTHLLEREVFIAIWIIIFGLTTLYLLGFIRTAHDSKLEFLSVTRISFAILFGAFTIYLIPGLWGAPLKIISGFPPPMFYSESPNGLGNNSIISSGGPSHDNVAGNPAHCPHNLNCFHDFDEALAYAKEVNKPLMLDFTGWACVNCRKMEEGVWADPRVLGRLKNNVVLVSLYVDEKTSLPDEEQVEVTIGSKTKKLKTIGNKWSYFQAKHYKTNSQPFYVFLGHNSMEPLHESAAYNPDIDKFIKWLDKGKAAFEKNNP